MPRAIVGGMRTPLPLLLLLPLLACDDPSRLVPPTVDEDASLPAIDLAGTRLHLRTLGDPAAHPVIFLHGGPGLGDLRAWERHAPLAEAGLFLVLWDQRGAGLSRRHDAAEIDLEACVTDLHALVEHVAPGGGEVSLVGHSWGGQYAVLYAARHPERVRRLVLSDPGPFTGALLTKKAPEIFAVDPFSVAANRLLWSEGLLTPDDHARADFRAALLFSEEILTGYRLSHADPMPFSRFGAVANAAVLAGAVDAEGAFDFDFTRGIEAWEGEALFVRAGENRIFDDAYWADQLQKFPRARVERLEGVGHDLIWAAADRHVALLRDFLLSP